jgi:hypothetical protein
MLALALILITGYLVYTLFQGPSKVLIFLMKWLFIAVLGLIVWLGLIFLIVWPHI